MSAPKLEWLQEFSFTPLETRSCVYKDSVLKEEKLIFSTFSKETSIFIWINYYIVRNGFFFTCSYNYDLCI
jgi:hypothetical protein